MVLLRTRPRGLEIITGEDPAPDEGGVADIFMYVDPLAPWGFGDDVAADELDFTSYVIRGLTGAIASSNSIQFFQHIYDITGGDQSPDVTVGDPRPYRIFDQFITELDGTRLVDENGVLNFERWVDLRDFNGLFFSGPQAMAVANGQRIPLDSRFPEDTTTVQLRDPFTGEAIGEPKQEGFLAGRLPIGTSGVLDSRLTFGERPREFSELERAILRDLGFEILEPEPAVLALEASNRARLIAAEGVNVHLRLDVTFSDGGVDFGGFLNVSAQSAALFPDKEGFENVVITDPNPADDVPALAGSIAFDTGAFNITLAQLDFAVAELLEFESEGVSFTYLPNAPRNAELIRFEDATITLPVLEGLLGSVPSATVEDFVVRYGGSVALSSAEILFAPGEARG